MDFGFLELSPVTLYQLGAAAVVSVLLLLLLASFMSRSRVFCQYLKHMTGIELRPAYGPRPLSSVAGVPESVITSSTF